MWQITEFHARLRTPSLSAKVNLRHPEQGLVDVEWLQEPLVDAQLLQVPMSGAELSRQLTDSYVRGLDLVTSYAADAGQSVTTQIYWRYFAHADLQAAGIEVIVSVRTESAEADSCLALGSKLPCRELLQAVTPEARRFESCGGLPGMAGQSIGRDRDGVGLFLRRLNDNASYVEMVHPADFLAVEFVSRGGPTPCVRSRFRLLEERVEKGVIRRVRGRGLLCPRQDDEAVAREGYRRWLASAWPLSA
jgi:hypothetical protein